MKRLFLLIAVFLLFYANLYPQTGWYLQNSGTSRNLNNLYFINSNTGWVAGDSVVLKTTNGGQNWIIQSLPVQAKINSVNFLNANTGFLAGERNYSSYVLGTYVLKTTNGGINWNIIYSNTPAIIGTAYIRDVYAINENTVIRTYSQYLAYESSGSILKSTDGGISYSNSLLCGPTKGLSFINSQTGWSTCAYSSEWGPGVFRIFRTTNEGSNWSVMLSDSIIKIEGRGIQFLNASTGYVIGYKGGPTVILKTTNGGINWAKDSLINYNNRSMYFANVNTGWIGGYTSTGNSNIARTTNGGINWSYQNIGGTQIINGLYFTDAMTGWAVGFYGVILKTITGGVTSIFPVSSEIPSSFSLEQNYPNPFNNTSNLKFEIANLEDIKIVVYDIMGREVQTLVNEELQPGSYEVTFDGSGLNSGVYFYQMTAGNYKETKKMLLLK
ncbi:MAG: T9SS type A sorting domain-containing protein [Ignavibacteria bacterium]|jgi:photosystem II stability/assembly factor-like uncharacterized protein|nr:T9SS type A sorting domain-containing protein [Ignavibacteria bacterium]